MLYHSINVHIWYHNKESIKQVTQSILWRWFVQIQWKNLSLKLGKTTPAVTTRSFDIGCDDMSANSSRTASCTLRFRGISHVELTLHTPVVNYSKNRCEIGGCCKALERDVSSARVGGWRGTWCHRVFWNYSYFRALHQPIVKYMNAAGSASKFIIKALSLQPLGWECNLV